MECESAAVAFPLSYRQMEIVSYTAWYPRTVPTQRIRRSGKGLGTRGLGRCSCPTAREYARPTVPKTLRNQIVDHVPEVTFQPLMSGHFQRTGIQSQLMQQRRMHIGHVMPVFHGVEPNLIRRPMHHAAL